jgi:hypothetical protein
MRRLVILALCVGAAVGWPARRDHPSAQSARLGERWRQDLDMLARVFPASQLDFDRLYPDGRFAAGLDAIARSLPHASDADVILALMRLVASANVAHTLVPMPQGALAFHRLPLSLYWFSDGLAVTAASAPHRAAVGLRVARIGSMTPAALEAAIAPYIAHEHDMWLHQQSPSFMVIEELLRALGHVGPDDRVRVTLTRPDGRTIDMSIAAGPWQNGPALITAAEVYAVPAALFRKFPNRFYWYEYLPERGVLFIQYNRCADDPAESFADFTRGLLTFADAHPVERVVIDLRFNSGGNSRIIAPLLEGLRARPALSARGRLFALMGRGTFSSGLLAAMSLRDDLQAVLVGEPAGEKPNSYGEVKTLVLPSSGLSVQYSTKFFRMIRNADPRSYDPDVLAGRTLADALAGRDPALAAALAYQRR